MRPVRYVVATSADAYIAGPKDEHDWIVMDPALDMVSFFKSIDTVLLGRRTFEVALRNQGGSGGMPGLRSLVFSRTLRQQEHPDIEIVADGAAETVARLREGDGKDIWLMGGGGLFRSLLDAQLVDTVEVAVVPVLLGAGIPLLPAGAGPVKLQLTSSEEFPNSGIVRLCYQVRRSTS